MLVAISVADICIQNPYQKMKRFPPDQSVNYQNMISVYRNGELHLADAPGGVC